MPPHATKNVHKPWNEGRVLFICDTGVSMYGNSPQEQGSNGAWRPATVWMSPCNPICQRCPRFNKTLPTITSNNTYGYTIHNGRTRLRTLDSRDGISFHVLAFAWCRFSLRSFTSSIPRIM